MKKQFYRFRPISRLLSDHIENGELQNQEIFFAHPSQLNDPVEGYRDIIWSGDHIVWENLFRHYVYTLHHSIIKFLIFGKEVTLTENDIPVHSSRESLPSDRAKELESKIEELFLDNKNILNLIHQLSQKKSPIRKDELKFYLSRIHLYAVKCVFDILILEKMSPDCNRIPDEIEAKLEGIQHSIFSENIAKGAVDNILIPLSIEREQIYLIRKINSPELFANDNREFLITKYPFLYVDTLLKVCCQEWYTACFMSDYSNSSVWGHYGSNHTGVCLIFNAETENDSHYLCLEGVNSISSATGLNRGTIKLKFHEIKYEEKQGFFDFFRLLGNISHPTMEKMWYHNKNGARSICAEDISASIEKWRDSYWDSFYQAIKIKTKDWSYEKEYRLIWHSSLIDLSEISHRVMNYDFKSLHGIIFGINTSDEDKIKIVNIIKEKCQKYEINDFSFYQAYFCFDDQCIKKIQLKSLNEIVKAKSNIFQ